MDVIDRIRGLHKDSDKNQKEIAQIINVGRKTYSDYEIRKAKIPMESVITLAKYYNVDVNFI